MDGAYNSKHSSLNEPEEGEILYSKDNVAIHPTRNASERIRGRLKMIKQGNSVFMTWVPYKGQSSKGRLSEQDKNLYSIKAVPFSDIRSIRRHTPTLAWQYVIIVMSSGLAFPPLYFYSGGVRQFLATIKQHVFLVRSAEDANVFLVNDFQNPLQRTLSSLELPRAVPVSSVTSPTLLANELPSSDDHEKDASNKSFGSSFRENDRLRRKHHDPARDLSIQVLEKFSLVTRFARETTSQLFRDGHIDGFFPIEERKGDQSSKEYHPSTSDDSEKVPEVSVSSDPREKTFSRKQSFGEEAATNVGIFELINVKEVDKLSLVWGKPRQPPLR
ncbi:GTPase-activating protein gyp7-like, partial [Primulina huaijiensis]|uniref:GTPase-activating protein gyp7-like n=1 Tax=Primulina huaijiensis TaxID=1492673 RepID=UPI003CC70EF2